MHEAGWPHAAGVGNYSAILFVVRLFVFLFVYLFLVAFVCSTRE